MSTIFSDRLKTLLEESEKTTAKIMADGAIKDRTPCPFCVWKQPKYFGGTGAFNYAYGESRPKSPEEKKAIGDAQGGLPKHSEEQKEKWKNDRKGVYKPVGTGGTTAYNDGVTEYRLRPGQIPDPTWVLGGLPRNEYTMTERRLSENRKRRWYNDGTNEYFNSNPQSNWVKGRLPK